MVPTPWVVASIVVVSGPHKRYAIRCDAIVVRRDTIVELSKTTTPSTTHY